MTWKHAIVLMGFMVAGLQGQNYRGAELRTHANFQYGRFETSLRSSQGDGYLCSFFTYNDSFPSTNWSEIDIEVLGRWPDNVDVNIIDEAGSHLRQHPLGLNTHQDYHQYGFEWTPDYVAWFYDGEEFYRQSGEHVTDLFEPQKLMMNIWPPAFADWVGVLDPATLPRYGFYDWVSYAEYTPGSGSVGTDNNFTPVWTDPFDNLDTTRWEKADGHGWNGNLATLVADNIVFQDGKMVLCLTLPGAEGIQDDQPPVALWARMEQADSIVVRFSELLDPVTANLSSTFTIPGAVIQSATLQEDQLTVALKLATDLTASSANVFALALRDQADPPNTQMGTLVSVDMPQSLALPIKIDCAGPGRQGFLPDQLWSSAVEYGHEGGNYQEAGDFPDLDGTELDSVMATSLNRYSRYHVRLQPGLYEIDLHFAEHNYTDVGQRTFELYVEDSLIVPELDVFAEAGNSQVYTLTLSNWEINDGSLDILGSALEYGRGYSYSGPVINAIEVNGEVYADLDDQEVPIHFGLTAIYPNPFNGSTQIHFRLEEPQSLELSLYDIRGRQIQILENTRYSAGEHKITLNATDLFSGVYIIKLYSNHFQMSRKVVILK